MSPSHTDSYLNVLQGKLSLALNQKGEINKSAKWIAESMKNQGWIYAFGTGHSHIVAEEIFYRAGGFARIRPILEPSLMLHSDATNSTQVERQEGFSKKLISPYQFSERDVLIIASNSGRNAVPIEMALEAKKTDAKVICLTNLSHSQSVESRHISGKKLFEVCDLTLDNFGEIGDAGTSLLGMQPKMGATSTIICSAILHAIMIETASLLLEFGQVPEVFHSSNTDEGEKENSALINKYKDQVKGL